MSLFEPIRDPQGVVSVLLHKDVLWVPVSESHSSLLQVSPPNQGQVLVYL